MRPIRRAPLVALALHAAFPLPAAAQAVRGWAP